jgi:hypothetical protein
MLKCDAGSLEGIHSAYSREPSMWNLPAIEVTRRRRTMVGDSSDLSFLILIISSGNWSVATCGL